MELRKRPILVVQALLPVSVCVARHAYLSLHAEPAQHDCCPVVPDYSLSLQGTRLKPGNKGELNASKYRDAVLKKVKPDFASIFGTHAWTFLHDGASPHKAASTNAWLDENVSDYIPSGPTGEWPANSPDLNIIEQIWGTMTDRLAEKRPSSIAALKTRVK